MSESTNRKFIVLYLTPAPVLAEWAKTDPEARKTRELEMQMEWQKWLSDHAEMIKSTEVGGKTKRVTTDGVSDTKNDILLYSFVEAESHDAVAKAFSNHPHLQIPQSSIEVMEVRPM